MVKDLSGDKKYPEVSLADRLKDVLTSWKFLTKDQEILSIIEGFEIHFGPSSQQSKFPGIIPMNPAQQRLVDMGILEMLEKYSYSGCIESKRRGISEQSFSCGEERWESSATQKFENVKQIYSLSSLEYGRFTLFEINAARRTLYVQAGLKRCILLDSIAQRLQKNDILSLQMSLSLIWFKSCYKDFHKDFENSIVNFEATQHKGCNIPGRYALIRKENSRSLNGKGHCNFLWKHLDFLINLKKSVLIPTQKLEFLKLIKDSMHLTVSRTAEKSTSSVLGDVQGTMCISFRTDKTDWSTFVNSASSAPSQNSI